MHVNQTLLLGKDDPSRINTLDALRACAILMVFNAHFFASFAPQGYFLAEYPIVVAAMNGLRSSHLGVDLFFLISGFFIFRSLSSGGARLEFFRRRAKRLMPAHLAVTIYILLAYRIGVAGNISEFLQHELKPLMWNILFIAPLLKTSAAIYNYVTWSLAWEWIFYVVIFLAALGGKRKPVAVLMISIAITLLIAFVCRQFFSLLSFPELGRFLVFFLGIVLAMLWERPDVIRNVSVTTGLTAVAGILGLQFLWLHCAGEIAATPLYGGYYIAAAVFFIVIALSFHSDRSYVQRILTSRPLLFLGRISYSFYLVHGIALLALFRKLPQAHSFSEMWVLYIVCLLAVTTIATLAFYLFERPYFANRLHHAKDGTPAHFAPEPKVSLVSSSSHQTG